MSQIDANRLVPPYLLAAEDLQKNAGQWQAYESGGHCVMLAGPGSGKTKVLTVKMARILSEEVVPPRGVACVTFNRQCVRELEHRLDNLGVEQSKHVFIGTVHSFCLTRVVLPYARLAGMKIPDPPAVASAGEWDGLFAEAVENCLGSDENPAFWAIPMRNYRFNHVDRDKPEWREDEQLSELIETFEKLLYGKGLIDFDGMVLTGLWLIEGNAWVREALKARFPILVVDEYQDLGYPLHRIVMSLCFDAKVRLLAVGDPDQSIYEFNAARPELLGELAEREDVESVKLRLNYRCGKTIIHASKAALGEARDYEAGLGHEGTIDRYKCPGGLDEQVSFALDTLVPKALDGTEGRAIGDIAVLYVDRYDGQRVADAAKARGYQFIRTDSGSPYQRSPMTGWLEDCAAWCAGGWKTGKPRLSALIRTWLRFLPTLSSDSDRRAQTVELVSFLYGNRRSALKMHDWLVRVDRECLREALDQEPTLRDEREVIDNLLKTSAPSGPLENFTVAAFGGQGGSPDHLNLMTLHSAKGSEFDVVIMLGLENGRIPRYQRKPSRRYLMEQRRLFYVGMTRARHEVHLLYSGWYLNRYGRFDNGSSPYVTEVIASLTNR